MRNQSCWIHDIEILPHLTGANLITHYFSRHKVDSLAEKRIQKRRKARAVFGS